MNSYQKRRGRIIRDYIIGWTLSFIFLSIVRGSGTEETGVLKFDMQDSLIISSILGPIIGLISGLAQLWMEERIYKRITIGRFLLLRLFYALAFILVLILLSYVTYDLLYNMPIDMLTFASDKGSFAVYLYVLAVDFLLNALHQINMLLGEGNLGRFIRGEFYTPREEDRIFMFLDLKGSTEWAERLGHVKYSSLIQDCFNDMGVVVEHVAEIYQYVGDEAVLTWKLAPGIHKENCIWAFYRFKQELQKRTAYYQRQFEGFPVFKAGLHCGKVTVTEIGKFKKEIAYHGDPINTAARIQGQCNIFKEELLISEALKSQLSSNEFYFRYHGDISLRGKGEEVAIYGVGLEQSPNILEMA